MRLLLIVLSATLLSACVPDKEATTGAPEATTTVAFGVTATSQQLAPATLAPETVQGELAYQLAGDSFKVVSKIGDATAYFDSATGQSRVLNANGETVADFDQLDIALSHQPFKALGPEELRAQMSAAGLQEATLSTMKLDGDDLVFVGDLYGVATEVVFNHLNGTPKAIRQVTKDDTFRQESVTTLQWRRVGEMMIPRSADITVTTRTLGDARLGVTDYPDALEMDELVVPDGYEVVAEFVTPYEDGTDLDLSVRRVRVEFEEPALNTLPSSYFELRETQ